MDKREHEVVDYNNHVTRLWGKDGAGHYTKLDDMYERYLSMMLPDFRGGKVLEVGPGTGQFAMRMHQKYNINGYTILDLEENIGDSKRLLSDNNIEATYILSRDYEEVFGIPFDLFVSNVCLPEVPEYYRVKLIDNVFPYCSCAFVIGGNDYSNYNVWIKEVFYKIFNKVLIEDTGYCGTFAISGIKLLD